MSTDEGSNLTIDAVPNPKVQENTNNIHEDNEDEMKDCNEEVRIPNVKQNPFKHLPKFKKSKFSTAQATIINISHANGIHVGDQYIYNASDRSEKSRKNIKETDAIKALKLSSSKLTRDDLIFIATHMNESWRDAIRELDYSDGQIEQGYADYHDSGIKEVIYQLLLSWSQKEPEKATLGYISNILWNNDQRDVVQRLSVTKK